MATYKIYNRVSGAFLGVFGGTCEDAAAESMHMQAGYASSADAAAALGVTVEQLNDELIINAADDTPDIYPIPYFLITHAKSGAALHSISADDPDDAWEDFLLTDPNSAKRFNRDEVTIEYVHTKRSAWRAAKDASRRLLDEAYDRLLAADYNVGPASGAQGLIVSVTSEGVDTEHDAEALADLAEFLGPQYHAEWSGHGNLGGDGAQTEDIYVEVVLDALECAEEEARNALLASDESIEYTLRDPESGVTQTIFASSDDEARAVAEDWAHAGDYGDLASTIWVDVYVARETDDGYKSGRGSDEEERVTVQIDPDPPRCTEPEHDWQSPIELVGGIEENPGVWGHGGGIVRTEVCVHCRCRRITDTWAQRPDTGEQGLDSVRYEPAPSDERDIDRAEYDV